MRVCEQCGETFQELAIKAILVDLGCGVYPPPSECREGGDHSFTYSEPGDDHDD